MAIAAGTAELAGVLLAAGFLTPLASVAIVVVMLNAIGTVHWRNGFWNAARGYEFNLLVLTAAVAIAANGRRAPPVRRVRSLQAGGKPLSPLRVALASGRRGR
jgi:uncharacterized membrane protein YphA (DoxX/SURF4 family)